MKNELTTIDSSGEITIDTKIYVNRTKLYLAPVLNAIDDKLPSKLNATNVIMWGVNDIIYKKVKQTVDHCIFILHRGENVNLGIYLEYIHSKIYFVDDYVFNIRDYSYHMSIIRVTRNWKLTYNHFVNGNFSLMYDKRQLVKAKIVPRLHDGTPNAIYSVLTKDARYREVFEEKVFSLYNTTDFPDDSSELDSFNFSQTFEVFNAKTTPGFKELSI
jgi:hypothetical protein